jgi:hypothetical protein
MINFDNSSDIRKQFFALRCEKGGDYKVTRNEMRRHMILKMWMHV